MCSETDEAQRERDESRRRKPPASPQDRARSHSVRGAILALLGGGREQTVADLHEELPGDHDFATVAYHLRVLRDVGLICARATDGNPLYRLA